MPDIPDSPSPSPTLIVEDWKDAAGRGAAFFVKAHAGARRDAVAGIHDGMLKVETTTAPEKGKANKAIQKFLAKSLGVPAGSVILLSGETNQRKRFAVRGVDAEDLRGRLLMLAE